jgi:uncharacterized lipoprotein
MQRFLTILSLLMVLTLITACGSVPCGAAHPYLDSPPPRPPLQAPTGMSVPVPDPTFQIPAGSDAQKPDTDACIITPPKVIKPDSPTAPGLAPAAATGKPATAAPAVRTDRTPPVAATASME